MAEKTSRDAQTNPSTLKEKDVSDGILDLLLTTAQIKANEKVVQLFKYVLQKA